MLGILRLIVAANHIKVQISFDLINERTLLHKVFRSEKPFLLSVPKSKNYIPFRLLSAYHKGLGYLQHRRYSGSIIIGTIVDLVAIQSGINAQMVEMCTYYHIFIRLLSGNHTQYVVHRQLLMHHLFQFGNGVRVHFQSSFLLAFFPVSIKRLIIALA